MKIPKAGSISERIVRLLYKNGKKPRNEIQEAMLVHGYTANAINSSIRDLRDYGDLTNEDGFFDLTRPLRHHYDGLNVTATQYHGTVAQPRTAPEFRPIQPKNQFWNALRREPIRDNVGFKTGTGSSVGYQS